MTESTDFQPTQNQEDGASSAAATTAQTAGQRLRQLREAQHVHLELLSATLKVPSKKIEALEEDRLDELPDLAFARALASSICRYLKVDAQAVLALLPSAHANITGGRTVAAEDQAKGYHASIQKSVPLLTGASGSWVGKLVKWLLVLVLLVLLASFALNWWLNRQNADAQLVESSGESVQILTAQDDLVVLEEIQPLGISTGDAVATATPVSAATSQVAVDLPAGTAQLTLIAHDAVWVEVRDANKVKLLSATLKAGERQELQGLGPLALNTGLIQNLELQLNGQILTQFAGQTGKLKASLEAQP